MAVSGKSSGENQTPENSSSSFFTDKTPILGQKLYVVIIATVVIMLFIFFLIFLFLRWNRNSKRRRVGLNHSSGLLPLVRNEITEVKSSDHAQINAVGVKNKAFFIQTAVKGTVIESEGKKGSSESNESSTSRSESSSAMSASTDGPSNIGWGRWYSLKDLEIATNQFSGDNVIGEGGYDIVYRGVLHDGSVAVKNLLNNKFITLPSSENTKGNPSFVDLDWNESSVPGRNDAFSAVGSKACRERKRREKLNDRFSELCSILEPGRPVKTDKLAILGDAIRVLNELKSESQEYEEMNEKLLEEIKTLKDLNDSIHTHAPN